MTLTDEEKEQIFIVERECFSENWTKDMLFEEFINPLSVLCFEKTDGVISGYILGKTAADEGEIYRLAVLPRFRRKGIAERLLKKAHEIMVSRGAVQCFLEVRSRNLPAIFLYEKSGYQKIYLRRNYYSDDDALVYRKDLI